MNQNLFDQIYFSKISFNMNDVKERLQDRYRWPRHYLENKNSLWSRKNQTTIKVLLEDQECEDVFDFDNYVDWKKVIRLYDSGYTIVVSGVEYLFSDISKITNLLNYEYGEITANLYAGKGTRTTSFEYHDHSYQVLVKNVVGKSIWKINDVETILEDQQAIYFKEHIFHCVKQIIEPKLSITFNIPPSFNG